MGAEVAESLTAAEAGAGAATAAAWRACADACNAAVVAAEAAAAVAGRRRAGAMRSEGKAAGRMDGEGNTRGSQRQVRALWCRVCPVLHPPAVCVRICACRGLLALCTLRTLCDAARHWERCAAHPSARTAHRWSRPCPRRCHQQRRVAHCLAPLVSSLADDTASVSHCDPTRIGQRNVRPKKLSAGSLS